MADRFLEEIFQRAPFLNPRGSGTPGGSVPPFMRGSSTASGTSVLPPPRGGSRTSFQPFQQDQAPSVVPGRNSTSFNNVLNLTCRQFYPHIYASENTISYADKINQNNVNLPNFIYGYSKHLLSILQGRVNNITPVELTSRVQNLVNIMNVVVTNSTLSDFNEPAWQIGREYANQVNRDIEEGVKSWSNFNPNIAADCYMFAKDHVHAAQLLSLIHIWRCRRRG